MSLADLIPDVDVLLALEPDEVAPKLLEVVDVEKLFSLQELIAEERLFDALPHQGGRRYPFARRYEINRAISEAWYWLELNAIIMRAPGGNGQAGFYVLTRRGERLLQHGFASFSSASRFSRDLLHLRIRERVWLSLARGDLASAVFLAFRTVEEAVREVGGYGAAKIGVPLMREAFAPGRGPLANHGDLDAEQEGLMHLFAGAIGSYKNPHSHRTVALEDPLEAQEMVLLASHLLRIVDARRPRVTIG